ncbi:MAG: molecular chaperone DnaJ, partial [Paludibacteraceae bacterium]|nr:molecular chaperone DnaJ [Paludibacteraceae bacterium]
GKIIESPCKACSGAGRKKKQRKIEVNIPAGVADDQVLNVSGQGSSGTNGGPSGDLHVYINVRPHPIFERRGNDVWCELPLTFTQAALGAEVVVPTIDGKVSYSVHDGTQPGDIFKLKGKGIPFINGRGRGDQYVKVTIEVPKNLSSKQKEVLKDFEKTTSDKNYSKRKSFIDILKRIFD